MFNKLLFKSRIMLQGKTLIDVAAYLGINYTTLYRKMEGKSDFFREEIQLLCEYLNLSKEERNDIFFAEKIT